MKFYLTGKEKRYRLIEVTTCAGLVVFDDVSTTLLSMFLVITLHVSCCSNVLFSMYHFVDQCLSVRSFYFLLFYCMSLDLRHLLTPLVFLSFVPIA
jgi:hypothetical protein